MDFENKMTDRESQGPGPSKVHPNKSPTVGETLDAQIARARQQVKSLCVKKAKAEALNILDHPAGFHESLLYPF